MAKKEIGVGFASRLLQNGPVCLLTVKVRDKTDIVPVAWVTPLSLNPPLVGVAVSPKRYSHDLIKKAGEFVLNIPHAGMVREVNYCGSVSGETADKFVGAGLTSREALRVGAPLIAECYAALECGLVEVVALGDHTLFVGQVLTAWADPDAFEEFWKVTAPEGQTLQHFGGWNYGAVKALLEP